MSDDHLAGSRGLVGDAFVVQVGRAMQLCINVGTFVVLARTLGAAEFGVFSTIVAVMATGYALADLGLGQFAVRAVAQRHWPAAHGIRLALPAVYAASTTLVVIAAVVSWGLTERDPSVAPASLLIGVSYVHAQARVGIERGLWLGALRVVHTTVIDLVASGARLVAVLAVWAGGRTSVMTFAWAIALAGIVTLWVVHRWFNFPLPDLAAGKSSTRRDVLREALPFGLSSLSWNALTEAPKLLLAPLSGTVAVGQYAAAARLLAAAYLPLQSVQNVVTPRVYTAAHATSSRERQRAFVKTVGLVTALGIALCAIIVGIAPALPFLLGAEYAPAVPLLRILAVGLPFQALAFAAGDWLGGLGAQPTRVRLTVATLLLLLPVASAAALGSGAGGAAVCFTGATVLLAIMSTVACWTRIRR